MRLLLYIKWFFFLSIVDYRIAVFVFRVLKTAQITSTKEYILFQKGEFKVLMYRTGIVNIDPVVPISERLCKVIVEIITYHCGERVYGLLGR